MPEGWWEVKEVLCQVTRRVVVLLPVQSVLYTYYLIRVGGDKSGKLS